MNTPIMSIDDELANLRAERDALAERLRQRPTMREAIGEIRTARDWLADGAHSLALKRLNEVLRRLEETT